MFPPLARIGGNCLLHPWLGRPCGLSKISMLVSKASRHSWWARAETCFALFSQESRKLMTFRLRCGRGRFNLLHLSLNVVKIRRTSWDSEPLDGSFSRLKTYEMVFLVTQSLHDGSFSRLKTYTRWEFWYSPKILTHAHSSYSISFVKSTMSDSRTLTWNQSK